MKNNIKTVDEIKETLNLTICELAQIEPENWLTPLTGYQADKLKRAIELLNEVDESLKAQERITPADLYTVDLIISACQQ